MIDLVVVGGGPVGLMTALHARLADLDVVVLEQRPGSLDKACGEGLMPDAVRRLRAVGVDPRGIDLTGIRYTDGRRDAVARFTAGRGRGVRRTELVAALRQRARELDIPVLERRVASVVRHAGHVVADDVVAAHLVAADGLHSRVRAQLGLGRPGGSGPRRFGVRQHYRVPPWTDLVEVHWSATAEVYVTPVADDLVGVAVLALRPVDLVGAVREVPELWDRLTGRATAGPAMGAGPLLQRTTARVCGRAMLVGDAAGYVDALTGEGLRVGFAEAQAAVSAVVCGDPARYERDWRRITRSYRLLTRGLLAATSQPVARRSIVPAASAWPRGFGRVVDLLAG